MHKYNDSPERLKLNLILCTQISLQMMKLRRLISTSPGHLLFIALKGSGISTLTKLVCFSAGYQLKSLEMIPSYTVEEWRNDLKKLLLRVGKNDE